MADEIFDIVRWIGPLMRPELRKRMKGELNALRAKDATAPYPFPDGIHKGRQSFGLSTVFLSELERRIHPNDAYAARVHGMLVDLKAPAECYVIAPDYRYYAKESLLPMLEYALGEQDGQEVVLMCLPGRLLYYQDQYWNRMIVARSG